MKSSFYPILGVLCLFVACRTDSSTLTEPGSVERNARVEATASGFASRVKVGTVKDSNLDEISGAVESRTNPGDLWVHEDSGNPNKIYLINPQGTTKATITLPSGALNRDWEDLTIGPGPLPNVWYIYLADIGDNSRSQSKVSVYRFVEPSIAGKSLPYSTTLSSSSVQRLNFNYATGARNAETLLIDPSTKDLLIITKEDNGANNSGDAVKGGIYRAAYPQSTSGTTTLSRSGNINVFTATGGDISADGKEVLIKNYTTVYHWQKSSVSQSISQLLVGSKGTLPYTEEPGGEAIAWKRDGSGYYTVSEIKNGVKPAIYYYARLP